MNFEISRFDSIGVKEYSADPEQQTDPFHLQPLEILLHCSMFRTVRIIFGVPIFRIYGV